MLVDRWGTWAAPDRRPHEVVVADPEALCVAVAGAVSGAVGESGAVGSAQPHSEWAEQWKLAEAVAQEAIDVAMAGEGGLTEPAVARRLVAWLPGGATLFVSSSMPVRDVECWGQPCDGLTVLSNRGVNGVDGALSSALGVAAASPAGAVTALVGDLAFLYDVSALGVAARGGLDLTVVVVDNDGGGIFSFLPQAKQPAERFERLWGTPHGTDLLALARAYGATSQALADLQELRSAVGTRPAAGQAAPSGPRAGGPDRPRGKCRGPRAAVQRRSEGSGRGPGRGRPVPQGRTRAARRACSFNWVSASSASGSDPGTTPAPA